MGVAWVPFSQQPWETAAIAGSPYAQLAWNLHLLHGAYPGQSAGGHACLEHCSLWFPWRSLGKTGSPAPSIITVMASWMWESQGTLRTVMGAGRGGRLRDGRARLGLRGPTGDREHVSGEHVFTGLLQHDSLQILEQNQPCVC